MNKKYVITEEMKKDIEENINILSEYCKNKEIAEEYKKMVYGLIEGSRYASKHEYLFLITCFELAYALHAYEHAMFTVAEFEEREMNEYKRYHKLN